MRVIEEPFTEENCFCSTESRSGFACACLAEHQRLVVLRNEAINQRIHALKQGEIE